MIKLWIANIGEDMPWNNLVSAANKAKAKAKIQENTHLDQQYFKGKWSLKMSLNSRNNHLEKAQKSGIISQFLDKAYQAEQGTEAKKKARKKKKKKRH